MLTSRQMFQQHSFSELNYKGKYLLQIRQIVRVINSPSGYDALASYMECNAKEVEKKLPGTLPQHASNSNMTNASSHCKRSRCASHKNTSNLVSFLAVR